MGHFLVERYVPAEGETSLAAETQKVSAGAGQGVRLLLMVDLASPEARAALTVWPR